MHILVSMAGRDPDQPTGGAPDGVPDDTAGGADDGAERPPRPRLRRGLFGVRGEDVERALSTRDVEIEELRREVAALWQTFAKHDRAIRQALAPPVEPPTPDAVAAQPPPGPVPAEGADPEPTSPPPSPAERRAGIEAQLSGLDDALTAIEQATQTLEKAYRPPAGPRT